MPENLGDGAGIEPTASLTFDAGGVQHVRNYTER
jgi:hypothetical protein